MPFSEGSCVNTEHATKSDRWESPAGSKQMGTQVRFVKDVSVLEFFYTDTPPYPIFFFYSGRGFLRESCAWRGRKVCMFGSQLIWRWLLHQTLSSLRTEPKSILSALPDRHLVPNKCSMSPFGVETEIKTEERRQRGE